MVKKNHYCSNPLLHKVELTTLRGLGLCPSNKTLHVDDNHCCNLSHASCSHSMHLFFQDGANLAGSSRDGSSVVLRSLRGNVFGSHGFVEENVVWSWKS